MSELVRALLVMVPLFLATSDSWAQDLQMSDDRLSGLQVESSSTSIDSPVFEVTSGTLEDACAAVAGFGQALGLEGEELFDECLLGSYAAAPGGFESNFCIWRLCFGGSVKTPTLEDLFDHSFKQLIDSLDDEWRVSVTFRW